MIGGTGSICFVALSGEWAWDIPLALAEASPTGTPRARHLLADNAQVLGLLG